MRLFCFSTPKHHCNPNIGRKKSLPVAKKITLLLAVALPLLMGQAAQAQMNLFSNLDTPASTTGGSLASSNGTQKVVAFTTGSTAYTLTSVQAYLGLNGGTSSTVSFGLYTQKSAGVDDPGTLVANLGNQTVTNQRANPMIYTFSSASGYVMTANTRYVLLYDYVSGDTTGSYWSQGNPQTNPTARNNSGYTNPVYRTSTDGGASYFASNALNLFALNGTVAPMNTPEPGTLPLLGMGFVTGAGMMNAIKRRKARITEQNAL